MLNGTIDFWTLSGNKKKKKIYLPLGVRLKNVERERVTSPFKNQTVIRSKFLVGQARLAFRKIT